MIKEHYVWNALVHNYCKILFLVYFVAVKKKISSAFYSIYQPEKTGLSNPPGCLSAGAEL